MANEWIGTIQTTAPKYIKGASDCTIRERLLLAMMENRGLITYNNESTDFKWDVQFAEPPVESYGTAGNVDYAARDLYKQASLDVRGYLSTDKMDEKDKLMNRGEVAIVNRYEKIIPNLLKGIRAKFGPELYCDGYASGNENRICGIGSWMGGGSAASATANELAPATDIMTGPIDTYAGLSTALGQSGSWSTTNSAVTGYGRYPISSGTYFTSSDWPEGTGDAEYDFFSPKLYNEAATRNTYWGAAADTSFADNAERVLSKAIQHLRLTAGATGAPTICIMSGNYFSDFKNALRAKQSIWVPHKEAEDLGFPDTLNFEGVAVNAEFGVPASTAYVLMLNEMELLCMEDQIFGSKGPDWSPKDYAYLFSVSFFGNLKITSPKFSAKIHNYPTA